MAIYVLEDDPGVNESLALLLAHHNFDVVCHADAESLFRGDPPGPGDVIFVDLNLPGVSGAATIRWLQSLRDSPLILVISGQSQTVIAAELLDLEVAGILRKPLDQDTILRELGRIGYLAPPAEDADEEGSSV